MIRFRLLVVIAVFVCTILSLWQIRHLGVDTSNEGFLHDDDPVLLTYNTFREQFGRDDKLAVAIQSEEIFTVEFLTKLKKLHEELRESVPHLNDITSMINARNTHGEGDVLLVDDLLTEFPKTEDQFAALKEVVLSSPL